MFIIPFSSLTTNELFSLAKEKLNSDIVDWERDIWQFIFDWIDPSVDSIKVSTSGSTGLPKQIEHCKGAVLNSARLTCEALHLKSNCTALLCLPANKISGMMMLVRSIWNKMDLYCVRPSSNPLLEITDKEIFDFSAFTPMQLYGIDADRKKMKKVERINQIIIGGEEIPESLLASLRIMKSTAYATFGMTETISHIALRKLNGKLISDSFTTLPGISISTDDRKCLVVEAPELGVHQLITNDVIQLTSSTQFEWLGRKDNIINSGGVKIFPEKIEDQLKNLIGLPFFITGVDNARTGQEVAIAIEKKSFTLKEAYEMKQKFEKLGKLCTPKSILVISKFLRTENGKIKRAESLQQLLMTVVV